MWLDSYIICLSNPVVGLQLRSYLIMVEILKVTYFRYHRYTQVQNHVELDIWCAISMDQYMFPMEICEEGVFHHSKPIGGTSKRDETKIGICKFNHGRHVNR